jgi:transposase
VNRRARRQKTDRVDARKLVQLLIRIGAGETDVGAEVRVPSAAAEAARHGSRERTALVREVTRLRNQISSWLATLGCRVSVRQRAQPHGWSTARDWTDQLLPASLQARLARAETRLALVREQLAVLEAEQVTAPRAAAPTSALRRLVQLKGVATTSAAVLLDEGLVWREFETRRQLGGWLGVAPLKHERGDTSRDPGIRRAGNTRLRSTMVQLAWSGVHWQPERALPRWYRASVGRGKRTRKIGIVALARKLLIALWRWATEGIVARGAVVKTV